jgi:hypothetical protein
LEVVADSVADTRLSKVVAFAVFEVVADSVAATRESNAVTLPDVAADTANNPTIPAAFVAACDVFAATSDVFVATCALSPPTLATFVKGEIIYLKSEMVFKPFHKCSVQGGSVQADKQKTVWLCRCLFPDRSKSVPVD